MEKAHPRKFQITIGIEGIINMNLIFLPFKKSEKINPTYWPVVALSRQVEKARPRKGQTKPKPAGVSSFVGDTKYKRGENRENLGANGVIFFQNPFSSSAKVAKSELHICWLNILNFVCFIFQIFQFR